MAASTTLVKPVPAVWSQRRQQARRKPRGAALCSCGHEPHGLVFELGMGLLPSVATLEAHTKDAPALTWHGTSTSTCKDQHSQQHMALACM